MNPSLILIERILGLTDRDPSSPTFGCSDRYFWNYKLHDVANARFQETALYFILVAQLCDEAARPALLETAKAVILFWANNRHRDGSVNEIYHYERSFCATSMSTQAVAGAWLKMDNPPDIDLINTGDWLLNHNNKEVANQMAGACLALERIAKITGENRFFEGAHDKFKSIQRNQLANGCFGEYGGSDIGYATITMSLLFEYHHLTGDSDVLNAIRKCNDFLEKNVNENGLFNWQTMSRRTQFLYPNGLSYIKSPVFKRLLTGLEKNCIINPLWMDDRYCIPLAIDYLLALRHL